jgi:DNA (cytosine-5)-methyltransferase 1
MLFGSVCSGIEAASVAWHPLGWKAAWLSEIEPFPCQVLAHHYPEIPNLGDMTRLPDLILSEKITAPDIFCGGTPCQAFSVAGSRKSLDDARGNLSLTFCEIANAIDSVRAARNERPTIIFWENVPGVLSTKDNAFGCFLAGLAGESKPLVAPGGKWTNAGCVFGPKRAIAWRTLDAQYFGVAQRRRRVFVVATARTDINPKEILFEFDSLRRDSAPRREARKEITGIAGAGIAFNKQKLGQYSDEDIASTCAARDYKDATDLVCVHGTQDPCVSDSTAFTVGRNNGGENVISYGIPGNWIGRAEKNGGNAVKPMFNLSPYQTKTDRHAVAVVESHADVTLPINTMTMLGRPSDDRNPRMGSGIGKICDPSPTLTKAHSHAVAVLGNSPCVRRLTPVECERLQGFPDNYTRIPYRNKSPEDCPDGPRYKALGNSWAVPVVRWIGERIKTACDQA